MKKGNCAKGDKCLYLHLLNKKNKPMKKSKKKKVIKLEICLLK